MLVGLGVAMATTNPSRHTYEKYAVERLTAYLKNDVCAKTHKAFGIFLQPQCIELVNSGRPQIQQIVSKSTQQQNFIFFSIYRTDLAVTSFIPFYHFETVGAFQHFYTYKAKKR